MKKRLICFVLVCIIALHLTGCGGPDESRATPSPDTSDTPGTELSTDAPGTSGAEPSVGAKARRTLMVYMIGSNLEYEENSSGVGTMMGLASADIEEMVAATHSDDVNIVIQTGGTQMWKNTQIKGETVQRFKVEKEGLVELEDLGKVCMTDEITLSEFIRFARNSYPADEYVLVLWDHGGGVPNGFGSDLLFPNETLTDVEIGSALKNANVHFSSIVFNACLMCSLEVYMAIRNYTDYAVASEAVVTGFAGSAGSGLDYRNFVNHLNDSDKSVVDCCGVLLDDYIAFMKERNVFATMSVVRMDRIEDVYNAYVDYIRECYQDLINGGYNDIVKARIDCGDFDGYDFVDLNMLATKYENSSSTKLRNAITTAVETTQSNGYANGLGITAYFPYELSPLYDRGRESLVSLNYDTAILNFYDTLASTLLYNNNLTQYAGSWYIEPAQSDANQGGGGGSTGGASDPVELPVTDMGSYKALALSGDDWNIVVSSSIRKAVRVYTETTAYYLGEDICRTSDLDESGYLILKPSTYCIAIGGTIPTSWLLDYGEDQGSGETYESYMLYAYVNEEPAFIRVTVSRNNEVSVVGYYPCNFDTKEYSDGYYFRDDDVIEPATLGVELATGNAYYYYFPDERCTAADMKVWVDTFNTSSYADVQVCYTLDDVNGQSYYTAYTSCK